MSKEIETYLGVLSSLSELPIYPLNFIKVLMQVRHDKFIHNNHIPFINSNSLRILRLDTNH